jgi:hypothetical protein
MGTAWGVELYPRCHWLPLKDHMVSATLEGIIIEGLANFNYCLGNWEGNRVWTRREHGRLPERIAKPFTS